MNPLALLSYACNALTGGRLGQTLSCRCAEAIDRGINAAWWRFVERALIRRFYIASHIWTEYRDELLRDRPRWTYTLAPWHPLRSAVPIAAWGSLAWQILA